MGKTFIHEEVINLIETVQFEEAIQKIEQLYPLQGIGAASNFSKQRNEEKGLFAYSLIKEMLSKKVVDNEQLYKKLDLSSDYVSEIVELSRLLIRIENNPQLSAFKEDLVAVIHGLFGKISVFIQENSNDYPNNTITGKVWLDGSIIRVWAQVIADYFGRKESLNKAIDISFFKAKVTLSIMSHYPESVGPDMLSVANKFEQKKDYDNALKFYNPVVLDFVKFLEEIESYASEDDFDFEERKQIILNSLIEAVEGLKRISYFEDNENLISRAKKLLNEK
ncbi:MAG: hypothetical protein AAF502_08960 [Bacteroidota bacterium]